MYSAEENPPEEKENWLDDLEELDEDIPEEDIRIDFVDRVEEAQRAVAWAAVLYEELYSNKPTGSWSDALSELVRVSQQFKQELASEQ